MDDYVTLDLGKYKIKDFKSDKFDGSNPEISFVVENQNTFYNDVIKTSEYFDEELLFQTNKYDIYGYLIVENRLFNYYFLNNSITIRSMEGMYELDSGYYIFAPIFPYVDANSLESNDEYYAHIRKLNDYYISFDFLKKLISKMESKYFKFEDDIIFLKGVSWHDLKEGINSIFDDYLIKIYEENAKIIVSNTSS